MSKDNKDVSPLFTLDSGEAPPSYPPPTNLPDYNPQGSSVPVPQVADDSVVPSVPPAAPGQQGDVVLNFTESQLNPYSASGQIGSGAPGKPPPGEAPTDNLLGNNAQTSTNADEADDGSAKIACFSLKMFQKYFDVETKDVLMRMISTFKGPVKANFFNDTKENADLYGPFWITTTLVFLTAVSTNIFSYYNAKGGKQDGQKSDDEAWSSNLELIAYAATLYYGYVFGISLVLFAFLKIFKSKVHLTHIWCMYGYALTVYLPLTVFWMMTTSKIWCGLAIALATIYSGIFLVFNFKPAIYEAAPARAIVVLITMAAIHAVVGVVLFVFHI